MRVNQPTVGSLDTPSRTAVSAANQGTRAVTDVTIQNASSDRYEIIRLDSLFADQRCQSGASHILGGKSSEILADAKYEDTLADLTEDCLGGTEPNSNVVQQLDTRRQCRHPPTFYAILGPRLPRAAYTQRAQHVRRNISAIKTNVYNVILPTGRRRASKL